MTPQFNLLRPQDVYGGIGAATFHRYDNGHTAYISFMLPRNSFIVLRVKRGEDYYSLTKVQQIHYARSN